MKLKLIAASLTLVLSACANTTSTQSTASVATNTSAPKVVVAEPAAGVTSASEITLNKAMSDPDWIGRAPESWYWGADSSTIFYEQKREGSKVRDLWRKSVSEIGNGEKVSYQNLHKVANEHDSGTLSPDGSKEVYEFEGNIFVQELTSGKVIQITHSSAKEQSPRFLTDGRIAYRRGYDIFAHNLSTNVAVELASLKTTNAPKGVGSPTTYLEKENHKLINYLALKQKDAKESYKEREAFVEQNSSLAPKAFYFGSGKRIAGESLSPNGEFMVVSIAKQTSWRNDLDIMPNYISLDGNIIPEKVRARVADNKKYSEELFLLNLKTGEKKSLSFDTLPGFDEDVLAQVRKENFARDGKTYESKKQARNIHLMQDWTGAGNIRWSADGSQVGVLLEAWDNKDRWLATVDFEKAELVSQHRLHDDAWVNYTHNEFGWLNDNSTLYFLSEESGYSQLYTKAIDGKAKALTTGQYNVNDLTLAKDGSSIYYRANKKHPGIYEIYKVDVESAQSQALTDLGGNNNYSLSPDNAKLLIEHSKVTMPPELYVQEAQAGATAERMTNTVSKEFLSMPWTAPSVVAVDSEFTEAPIYAKVYMPKNEAAANGKAVIFNHGAGYLQNSHLGWSGYFREFMFHSMLTQQGYVVMDMDYRGSKGYGRDWRTAIYRHMGKSETQDLTQGVDWLVENAGVDRNRVGTYGGSYGGFMTFMALFTEPELFQAGAALRPVSDWAYYNHGYTSNILNTPEDDPIAYEQSSPIYFAEGLNKPLLINAPMVDNNVFFQDVVRLVQRLIELEKDDFETAIFPVEPHGFKQPSSWLDEYKRIYKLFENNL